MGINIQFVDKVSYCKKRKIVTTEFRNPSYKRSRLELSGTMIRDLIQDKEPIPEYLIHPRLAKILKKLYKSNPKKIFV